MRTGGPSHNSTRTPLVVQFMRKQGAVAVELARLLLTLEPGDRLPPIADLAQRFDVGNGTIHEALKSLESVGAIQLKRRGHLGTVLVHTDDAKLWQISGNSTIMGLMPLPYSRRYEGLATALYECFDAIGLPLSVGYMRGSSQRVQALCDGNADFVVTSALAAEAIKADRNDTRVALWLGRYTYSSQYAILTADPQVTELRNGMRIGIDPASIDQVKMTEAECAGLDVEYVRVRYTGFVELLRQRVIDAAIWNTDEVVDRYPDIRIVPLRNEYARELAVANTEAAIVVPSDRIDLLRLFSRHVRVDQLRMIQQEVVAGRRLPSY